MWPASHPWSSQYLWIDCRYGHQLSGSKGETPAIRLAALVRWFEIGIRIVGKPSAF